MCGVCGVCSRGGEREKKREMRGSGTCNSAINMIYVN